MFPGLYIFLGFVLKRLGIGWGFGLFKGVVLEFELLLVVDTPEPCRGSK